MRRPHNGNPRAMAHSFPGACRDSISLALSIASEMNDNTPVYETKEDELASFSMKFAKKGRRHAVGSPGRMTRGSECGSPSSAQPPSTCSRRPSLAILTGDLASPKCFSTIAIYGRHVLLRARVVKRQQTPDDQEGGYIPLREWQHSFAHDAMHEARGLTKTCGLLEIGDWRT